MKVEAIDGVGDPLFGPALALYHESFDEASRDPDEDFARDADGNGEYVLTLARDEQGLHGFIRWGHLERLDALFVIHLAVVPSARGRGIGARLIGSVCEGREGLPVLLEVDPESDSYPWWGRRGARTLTPTYTQPALHPHTGPVPFHLMAMGEIADVRALIRGFYDEVWNLRPDHPFVARALEGVE